MRDGAWFACVSDSTRRDLVSIYPAAEERSVTIHNMVSHHYFPESSSPARVPEILRTRRNLNLEAEIDAGGGRGGSMEPIREPGPTSQSTRCPARHYRIC